MLARFVEAQDAFPFKAGILVISSPFDSLRSLRVNSVTVENGAAGEAATWTGRPKAERTGGEQIKSLDLSVLQHISTNIFPSWIQLINQADFLRSRPLLKLRLASDRIADIAVVLVID